LWACSFAIVETGASQYYRDCTVSVNGDLKSRPERELKHTSKILSYPASLALVIPSHCPVFVLFCAFMLNSLIRAVPKLALEIGPFFRICLGDILLFVAGISSLKDDS
jgi:hypothetical protein